MPNVPTALLLMVSVIVFAPASRLEAQVTTATLVGLVRDTSGAVLPGASVVATHQGTGVPREGITDERGEFVLSALPNGSYSVRIEMPGFKSQANAGMVLGSGQTVRQTFTLEVGEIAETVTVAGSAPLIETATSSMSDTLTATEVRELPVSRRNVASLLSLTPGVSMSAGGSSGGGLVNMSGVGGGGTGITVDGTEANANPEARSTSHYGGQNQISVMSLDAVQEVSIVKGVLPAEYGGVAGGQVNLISRSGTNVLHGSAFYNLQNQKFNARNFLSTTRKPTGTFNQYGGTLGGPVLRNKLFFFTTYEGYREEVQRVLSANVPYQHVKNALLAALPFPETKVALDTLPLPTEPIVSSAGVVDPNRGSYQGLGVQRRTEDHIVARGDLSVFNGANLAVTYTRMRPYTLEPRFNVGGSNDRVFPNEQDRIASQFVMTHGQWVSESRFGWNRTYLARVDAFIDNKDPNPSAPPEIAVRGRRVGILNVTNLFSTPAAELFELSGNVFSLDQKFSRGIDRHLIKMGFRWMRNAGSKVGSENPQFTFQSLNDALANIPTTVTANFGSPSYWAHLSEFGAFIQDDWRVGSNLVLNLGLRYDYYATLKVRPVGAVPVENVNLAPPTDLRKLDFGGELDPEHAYEPDAVNFGPRMGFAWTVGGNNENVVRGGVGYLYSPHLTGIVRQITGEPHVSFRGSWNRTEAAARGLKWPYYNDGFRNIVITEGTAAGRKSIFSVIDQNLPSPYTIQTMLSYQRALGRVMATEIGYIRTNGNNFPLQRSFALAKSRETGLLPNPLLGAAGGFYVDGNQTMEYNALQASLRKRFSNNFSFDVNYTLGKGLATQGGDLSAGNSSSGGLNNIQDFWDPESDRGPTVQDVRHRLIGSAIVNLPSLSSRSAIVRRIAGDWQVSGIITAQSSGVPLNVTQASGINNSRPDVVAGADLVIPDWRDTCGATGCNYLNTAAWVPVPINTRTNATIRPGTSRAGEVRGPAQWDVNATFAKNFRVGGETSLQVRADVFSAFNRMIWGNPVTAINNSQFGRLTSAGGNRSVQLGARLTF
jgi:outer membrane receptor protein involved in Fe transport